MHYLEEINRVLPMLKEKKAPISKKTQWKKFTKEYPRFTVIHDILFRTYFYAPIDDKYEVQFPEALLDIIKEIEHADTLDDARQYCENLISSITFYLTDYYTDKFGVDASMARAMASDMEMKTNFIMRERIQKYMTLEKEAVAK